MPSSPLLSPRATYLEKSCINLKGKTESRMKPKSSFAKNSGEGKLSLKH